MNSKIVIFFVFLFIGWPAYSQNDTIVTQLNSIVPTENDSDLQQLDRYFKTAQVVGLGESTHGTHEFWMMRFRIFQYLVKHHDFSIFFLEADYANCLRLNRFILGSDDDVEEAIQDLGQWPWITAEMVEIANWMRTYNSMDPQRKLKFMGVDAQNYNSTLKQIDALLYKYDLPTTDTLLYQPISFAEFFKLKPKQMESYFELVASKDVDLSKFNSEDRTEYSNLLIHLKQSVEIQSHKKSGDQSEMRDKYMGKNLLRYLEDKQGSRGIYWAHTGHSATLSFGDFKTEDWGGSTGGYLKEVLGQGYFSIGLDFDEGSFNAWYPDSKSETILEKKSYTLGSVTVGPSVDETFGAYYRNFQKPIFIDFDDLPIDQHLFLHLIGAAYLPKKEVTRKSMARYNYLGENGLDAMILIKESTPTTLVRE